VPKDIKKLKAFRRAEFADVSYRKTFLLIEINFTANWQAELVFPTS
jgi:hypothetical protein